MLRQLLPCVLPKLRHLNVSRCSLGQKDLVHFIRTREDFHLWKGFTFRTFEEDSCEALLELSKRCPKMILSHDLPWKLFVEYGVEFSCLDNLDSITVVAESPAATDGWLDYIRKHEDTLTSVSISKLQGEAADRALQLLGHMRELRYLRVDARGMCEINTDICSFEWSNLRTLKLDLCLQRPAILMEMIGCLAAIEDLDLHSVEMKQGTIESILSNCPLLRHIFIYANVDNGTTPIPLELRHQRLTKLQLRLPHSTRRDRTEIVSVECPKLRFIKVARCNLTRSGCLGLLGSPYLQDLRGLSVAEDCSEVLSGIIRLRKLQLRWSFLSLDLVKRPPPLLQSIKLAMCPGLDAKRLGILTSSLPHLAHLIIADCNLVATLEVIRSATLRELRANRCQLLSGEFALAGAPNVASLRIRNCPRVRSIRLTKHKQLVEAVLFQLEEVREIEISGADILDRISINRLENLESLRIESSSLQQLYIDDCSSLPTIARLTCPRLLHLQLLTLPLWQDPLLIREIVLDRCPILAELDIHFVRGVTESDIGEDLLSRLPPDRKLEMDIMEQDSSSPVTERQSEEIPDGQEQRNS